jgi:hypothetical protein
MEKLGLSYIAGRVVRWCDCFGEQPGTFLKRLNVELYNSAVILIGREMKKNTVHTPFVHACSQQHP